MGTRTCLAVALCLGLAAPASAETLLILDSQPGDYVGQGILRQFVPADGTFSATRNFDEGVDVSFDGAESWNLSFAAPGGALLTPLLYPGATRFPFQETAEPGLSVSGEGRGCNELTGSFQVHEITYGAGDAIDSFAADFVQYCDNSNGPMVGSIRFNSSDALPPIVDEDADGAPDIADNCVGLANADQHDADLDGAGDACDASLEASFVVLDSEAGDYVGQGELRHFNADNAFFSVGLATDGAVELEIEESASWHVELEATGGGAPAPGVYEGATRYPFNGPTEPGLSIGGDGRGCNTLTGRFEVFEAEYGPGGEVTRFSADFEQHCEGGGPALKGSVRWRAAFRPAPKDHDGDGRLAKLDNCPGVANPTQTDADDDGFGDVCGLLPPAQKCVNDLNQGGAGLARVQGSASLACLKNAAKGAVDKLGVPATAQDCLTNDVGGKQARAVAKLTAKEASSCAASPPAFGRTSAATIGAAASAEGAGLMGDLLGDLDGALILAAADPVGAKCQEEVAKRTNAAVDALWKLTLKQKKAVLSGAKVLMATDAQSLGDMLVAHVESDPKAAASKPFAALASGAAKRCGGVASLATAFPGCAPADLPALTACAERAARCRFCEQLSDFDGLPIDCDLFDDGDDANGSCGTD